MLSDEEYEARRCHQQWRTEDNRDSSIPAVFRFSYKIRKYLDLFHYMEFIKYLLKRWHESLSIAVYLW